MNIKTCKYVEASEIFKDYGLAWDVFVNSDPDCTWGDNNRSLVTADVIVDVLENSEMNVGAEENHVRMVVERLRELPDDVYVDLET
jgi:hypothetical protein